MSSTSRYGAGFGTTLPQTGNSGRIPSLDQHGDSRQHDTGFGAEVQEKLHNVVAGAAEVSGQVRDTARQWAGSAVDAVGQGFSTTRQSLEGAYHEAKAFVRGHPGVCMFAAFATGALVGICLTVGAENRYSQRPQW
jgi:hypothetical protein